MRYTQYRGHQLVTAPATEPVSAADVKNQLELDVSDTSKDTQIDLYIESARQVIEQYTGLAFINQTWRLTLDNWPSVSTQWWDGVKDGAISELYITGRAADILLPRYPLSSITSITVDDSAITVASYFIIDTDQKPGRLVLKDGSAWPVVDAAANGIKVTYVAGFGSSSSDVPATLRLAVIQMAAYMFEHRGDCNTDDAMAMSGAKSLVDAYRIRGL